MKVIGRGGAGKVFLVTVDNQPFALKCLRKDFLIEHDQVDNARCEAELLPDLDHPFIVRTIKAFQTPEQVCFLMDFVRGGDLFR